MEVTSSAIYPLALLVCRAGKRDDYIILSPSNISGWTST